MSTQRFANREDAGRLLGSRLLGMALRDPIVLGLPRGGVVVAAQAAAALGVHADVFVARKIGHPAQRELGVGAIAEGGEPTYDEKALRRHGLSADDLAPVVAAERAELARRVAAYRTSRQLPALADRDVVLIDDGIATGATARAALRALRAHAPSRLVFAAPVGPLQTPELLVDDADDIVVLRTPLFFVAVGRWYDEFGQVGDDEVRRLLAVSD